MYLSEQQLTNFNDNYYDQIFITITNKSVQKNEKTYNYYLKTYTNYHKKGIWFQQKHCLQIKQERNVQLISCWFKFYAPKNASIFLFCSIRTWYSYDWVSKVPLYKFYPRFVFFYLLLYVRFLFARLFYATHIKFITLLTLLKTFKLVIC